MPRVIGQVQAMESRALFECWLGRPDSQPRAGAVRAAAGALLAQTEAARKGA